MAPHGIDTTRRRTNSRINSGINMHATPAMSMDGMSTPDATPDVNNGPIIRRLSPLPSIHHVDATEPAAQVPAIRVDPEERGRRADVDTLA